MLIIFGIKFGRNGEITARYLVYLYDGRDNALTDWLQKRKVAIIRCRTPLFERLRELSRRKQDPQILAIGAGAFLRVELPRIALELGMDDSYVLYTDCDVMFMEEMTEDLQKMWNKRRVFECCVNSNFDHVCIKKKSRTGLV